MSMNGVHIAMAALFTRQSKTPRPSMTAAVLCQSDPMSKQTVLMVGHSATKLCRGASDRDTATTLAPHNANFLHRSRPIPAHTQTQFHTLCQVGEWYTLTYSVIKADYIRKLCCGPSHLVFNWSIAGLSSIGSLPTSKKFSKNNVWQGLSAVLHQWSGKLFNRLAANLKTQTIGVLLG